jgi:F-type H+-transporting ATPase subunit a
LVIVMLAVLAPMLRAAGPGLPEKAGEPAAQSTPATAETATAAESAEHGLSRKALEVGRVLGLPVTNSMIVTWIVALGLIVWAQLATRKIQEVPSGAQNVWEWVVESLYEFLESILGSTMVKRTFWFLATIFIFILFTNWFGLVPGVGTVGWGVSSGDGFELTRPLLRGGNADLNMPLAMAMLFFLFWTVWALQANGLKGFALHIFGPKAELAGVVGLVMIVIFILVGFLETISIFFRPIALTFRLYGNMFAGENVLESMSHLIQHPAWAKALFSVVLPVPFYFMELLVGLVQALVFMLLCAVFTAVICLHEEEHGEAHH